jgi:hypothetical protein
MNARLIKETRDLLPIFVGSLLLIAAPYLIWRGWAGDLGCVVFGLACAVLGGSSFGNEFQHRTLSVLLSQPIARSVMWREKMLILGGAMLASLLVLVVCLLVCSPVVERGWWLALVLIPLCAFCGAPYWTLLLRHGIGGMAFGAAIPTLLLSVNALVMTDRLFDNKVVAQGSALLLVIYCAVVYRLGYVKFKGLQVVDGPSRELSLPAGLEAIFVRPLSRISARFHGQFATLLKKEFRLQQTSFVLTGLFFLIALTGAFLIQFRPELGKNILGGDYIIYVLILPLITGAISVAEEKGWELAEWHLTLPPSALTQWSAKMLATLSISLALGLLLPTAMFLAGEGLSGVHGAWTSLPPASEIVGWVLGQLLLTSVAVYAASFSNNTLRAILAAFGIIAAGVGVLLLLARGIAQAADHLLPKMGQHNANQGLILPLLLLALGFMLCLFQWFAWSNFRRYGVPACRIVRQLAVILLSICLIMLVFFSAVSLLRGN